MKEENEIKIEIDYHQVLKWIRDEYKKTFHEQIREDVKKKWISGEISIEELRRQKEIIDRFYKNPETLKSRAVI